jgi:hypothetical protein
MKLRGLVCGILFALACLAAPGAVGAGNKSKAGEHCGGMARVGCEDGLWCEVQGRCGSMDLDGICVKVPEVCTQEHAPVCGCDKTTYGNDCERQMKRVQKDRDGACAKQ